MKMLGTFSSTRGIRVSSVSGVWLRLLTLLFVVSLVTSVTAGPNPGTASQLVTESTLDRVLASKVLRVGFLAAIPPFGDYNENNEFVGYDRDVAQLLADDLGAELQAVVLPDPPARIAALVSGEVDIVVAALSLTPQRSQSIAFTHPYAPDLQVLLGRVADTDIQDYTDLGGKRVGIVTGSTQEIIAELAPDAEIIRLNDIAASQQAFQSGQVDVYIVDDGTAAAAIAADPSLERKGVVTRGYLALGVRRNDPEWLRWVNDALIYHGGSGDLAALYQRWFGAPMPQILPDF